MSNIANFRRENLRRLIAQHGGPNALAETLGYSNGSFIVQMAGPRPIREVSERTARRFETLLNLPAGILDQPVEMSDPIEVPKRRSYKYGDGQVPLAPAPQQLSNEAIGDLIRVIGQLSSDDGVTLPPIKFSDILMLSMADAIANHGQPDTAKIKTLLSLVK